MGCKKTQDNMMRFLQGELELDELKKFLIHVELCEICKEELEIYYTFYTAMKLLEEDPNCEKKSYKIDLKKELEKGKEKFKRTKRIRLQKSLFLYILIFAIGIFII